MRYFTFQFFSFLLPICFKLLCDFILLKQHHFPVMHNLDSKHKAILPKKTTGIASWEDYHQPTFQIKQDKLRRNKEVFVSIPMKLDQLKFAPLTEADTSARPENIVRETAYHFVGFPNSSANQVTEYRTWNFLSCGQNFCWF